MSRRGCELGAMLGISKVTPSGEIFGRVYSSGQTTAFKPSRINHLGKAECESPGPAQALSTLVSCEIGTNMLWTILVVLFVLWLLGVVTSYTLGGFIHVLLLVALAVFVINMIQGRRRSA